MILNLRKIAFDQTSIFIDEIGNAIPVFKEDMSSKYEQWKEMGFSTPWIVCISEASWSSENIHFYKMLYGTFPQKGIDELRRGFSCDFLEAYSGRMRIELYN